MAGVWGVRWELRIDSMYGSKYKKQGQEKEHRIESRELQAKGGGVP